MPRSSDAVIDGGVVNLDAPLWTYPQRMLKTLLTTREAAFYWDNYTGGINARPARASVGILCYQDADHVRLNCTTYIVWYGRTPVAFFCRHDGWTYPALDGLAGLTVAQRRIKELITSITDNEES